MTMALTFHEKNHGNNDKLRQQQCKDNATTCQACDPKDPRTHAPAFICYTGNLFKTEDAVGRERGVEGGRGVEQVSAQWESASV